MNPTNGTGPQVGACDPVENIAASNHDTSKHIAPRTPEELLAARQTSYLVARHYVTKLGWPVMPAYHNDAGECGKHPSGQWNKAAVAAGRIVGPATTDEQCKAYFLDDRRGLADICVLSEPAQIVVLDCDQAKKVRVVDGQEVTQVVDGLKNLLDFTGGDIGHTLMSRTRRGLHLIFAADSDDALRIKTQAGALLEGVDVRGCHASGGVTVESNGVCPHRGWVSGTPDTGANGEITGIESIGPIEFDGDGNCISGLPMAGENDWPEGIEPLPPLLLDALLFTSGVRSESEVDARVVSAWRQRLESRGQGRRTLPRGPSTPGPRGIAMQTRPYTFSTTCTCGACDRWDEAVGLLAWVAPEVGRDTWLATIYGVSHMLTGSRCGAALVAEWSELSTMPTRCDGVAARSIYLGDRRRRGAAHVG